MINIGDVRFELEKGDTIEGLKVLGVKPANDDTNKQTAILEIGSGFAVATYDCTNGTLEKANRKAWVKLADAFEAFLAR